MKLKLWFLTVTDLCVSQFWSMQNGSSTYCIWTCYWFCL